MNKYIYTYLAKIAMEMQKKLTQNTNNNNDT